MSKGRQANNHCHIAASAGIGMADELQPTRARPGNLNHAYECEGARGMRAFRYLRIHTHASIGPGLTWLSTARLIKLSGVEQQASKSGGTRVCARQVCMTCNVQHTCVEHHKHSQEQHVYVGQVIATVERLDPCAFGFPSQYCIARTLFSPKP